MTLPITTAIFVRSSGKRGGIVVCVPVFGGSYAAMPATQLGSVDFRLVADYHLEAFLI